MATKGLLGSKASQVVFVATKRIEQSGINMRFAVSVLFLCAPLTSSLVHVPVWPRGHSVGNVPHSRRPSFPSQLQGLMAAPLSSVASSNSDSTPSSTSPTGLSDDETKIVDDLYKQAVGDDSKLEQVIREALPSMHPRLVVKLRQFDSSSADETVSEAFQSVAKSFVSVMNAGLEGGRDVLKTLMEAGEIRKLDASIGRAAREGKLDMAFFTVLNMNLQDAQQEKEASGEGQEASRLSILQHIYTRCQEEIEKAIPPGTALLNKLLRTDVVSIRVNQLKHYLCPQPNVIKSPDGKEIKLEGTQQVLVAPSQLVEAMAAAVKQIRTVEKAGGTDRESAAAVVESMRQVAIEARMVIGESYGVDSKDLLEFEDSLMPVFRPSSPDSPYIQGK